MKRKKIKVFLSGIVNSTNAQNLNCLALAKHLDKSKFEVRALTVYSGNLPTEKIDGVKYLPVRYPAKVWHPVQLIRGILWADVSYLCKPEYWRLQRWLVRIFGKRSFGTVEGVYSGVAYERAVAAFGSEEGIREFHAFRTKSFAITKAMIEKNRQLVGLPEQDGVLYLGTDYDEFAAEKQANQLTDVILIGADLKRKGVDDYLVLANRFPQIKFHVAGGAVGGDDYKAQCMASGLDNVVFHGSVNHAQLKELLKGIQLHIFPSRAEGFPKVTLETAAAGVPSIVYGDYGANEWITTGKDGFVVGTIDEMAKVVRDLLNHPSKLQPLSDNARTLAQRFDWNMLVKDWEQVMEKTYKGDTVYAYPILTGAGLGNKLFRWARAVVFCKRHGIRMLAPSWVDVVKIGPWIRGDRYKRYYGAMFSDDGYLTGLRKIWTLLTFKRCEENEYSAAYRRCIVKFAGMKGFFSPFLNAQPIVRDELWRIVNGNIKRGVEDIANQGPFVAVHVRLGDFSHLGCAASEEWYINAIRVAISAKEAENRRFLRVFSDGYPEELEFVRKAFPEENVVIMPKAAAIQDILTMSQACVLVGSPGSTFSMWAVFLGQMPSVWNQDNYPSKLYNGVEATTFVS